MRVFLLILLLFVATVNSALSIVLYYGDGCQHCAATEAILEKLAPEYNLSIVKKEVRSNHANLAEMLDVYYKFGIDPSSSISGVPSTLIQQHNVLVLGEMKEEQWRGLLSNCSRGMCKAGVYTANTFFSLEEKNNFSRLTFAVLIGAAIVDSINPCTIAIMVMLLGVILTSKGRKSALIAGLLFSFTIFIMYLVIGLGVMKAIGSTNLQNIFFAVVTSGAAVLAFLELRAYFYYQPGIASIEMPLFLRPYAKGVIEKATSYPGVAAAAVFCSLFLLPCSSGPYLMVLGMLSKSASFESISYLIIYNFVFILPMLIITIAIYLGKTTVDKMTDLKETYIREIHLLSGIILLIMFLFMLKEALSIFGII